MVTDLTFSSPLQKRQTAIAQLYSYVYYRALPSLEHILRLRFQNVTAPSLLYFFTETIKPEELTFGSDVNNIPIPWDEDRRLKFDESSLVDKIYASKMAEEGSIELVVHPKTAARHIKLDEGNCRALLKLLSRVLKRIAGCVEDIPYTKIVDGMVSSLYCRAL